MTRTQKITLMASGVALLLGGLSVADPRGLRRLKKLEHEIAAYDERNEQLARQNASLRQEIEALSGDLKALERAAREDLGLIKPNEVVFNFER